MSLQGFHGAYLRAEHSRVIGPDALRKEVATGRLVPFSRTVLVEAKRSVDFLTRAAASLLLAGPDSLLTGQSSVALHGFPAAATGPVHVLLPHRRRVRSRPGVAVHQGRFAAGDVAEVVGLRTLSLEPALAAVLCDDPRREAFACADQVVGSVPPEARAAFRARLRHRVESRADRRGVCQARALLELADGMSESPAESSLLVVMVDRGLPPPVQQHSVLDLDGREVYRLDFAWPEVRVAVEYDGYEAHVDRARRDELRDADLRRRGWAVIRADAADLRDPTRLVQAVHAAFGLRGLAA